MTTEVISQTLTAGQQATFGQGRVLYIKSANAAVSVIAERKGNGATVRKLTNIGAGFKFTVPRGEEWTYLRITSATTQAVELVIGDDDVEVANAVSVTGTAVIQDQPSATIATPAALVVANTNKQSIAANAARRRITICNLSTNAGSVFVQFPAAGAGLGIELQSGQSVELRTTAAFDLRNDSGAAVTCTAFEET